MAENPDWKKEMKELLEPIQNEVSSLSEKLTRSPIHEEKKEDKKEAHKTLVEQMLCEDCTPRDEYKKAHLELMGQKECKECGNIDGRDTEFCENCQEEYGKEEG